eukprot:4047656-Amphidinium_carterae.1
MKWPTWALLLMLRMSPPLNTFVGRLWPRLCVTSGFWLDLSLESAYGSLPRLKRRLRCPPG